jgi:hypothetical protein
MAFKDILLALTSYPDPTPVSVVEDAVSLAATLGAHLSAVSCEVRVEVPGHFLAGSIANLPGIVAGEAEKSRKHAKDLLAAFAAAAEKSGVPHEVFLEKCPTYKVPETSWSTTPGCAISPSCRCRNPTINGTRTR